MFDFNDVINDNNSKETTDKVFLSMLDIRVLFFNKYNYLIDVKKPSEYKEFQKITNIIDNTYGNKNNKCPFIMEKQFHLLLEKYFKVIDTKQLSPEYKEHEPYFTNNSKKSEQIIYTDGIFIIEEIRDGSLLIFSSDCDYSIKLASYNDKLIEQIADISYPSHYNKIVGDITEGCLSPLNYYNKLLEIFEYVTLEGFDSYMLNYNLLKGAIQFYMDKSNPNKFYFVYDTIYMKQLLHKRLVTQNKKLCDNDRFVYLFKFGNRDLYDFIEVSLLSRGKQTTIAPLYSHIANVNVVENSPVSVKLTIDSDLSEIPEYVRNLCVRIRLNPKNEYKENTYSDKTLKVLTVEFL